MDHLPELVNIVKAIKKCLPREAGRIELHEPCFNGNEWAYVKDCLDSGWVSPAGRYVDRFEEMVAGYTGARSAVAVASGTAALHLCLLLAGVERGDEVLVPALTFVATANAAAYCGAIPHFADIDENTLGLDPCKLADYLGAVAVIRAGQCYNRYSSRRIKAVVPVHAFGHPADLDPLAELCARYRLALVEDAAEALGSLYKGRHAGNWGSTAALSFNGNKTATTGGGGAIITGDAKLARLARHLSTTAKASSGPGYYHDRVGFNYRLPGINAALGCAQMEQLPGFIERKRALAERYAGALAGTKGIRFFREPGYARSNYWLNAIIVDGKNVQAGALLEAAAAAGVMVRPAWTLLHRLPMYLRCPAMELVTAEYLQPRLLNLPSSPALFRDAGGAAGAD